MDKIEPTNPQPLDREGHGHKSEREEAGEPYEYTPLPEPEPVEPGRDPLLAPKTLWTRLITIHPGEYDDDIVVDLSDMALEKTAESQLHDNGVRDPPKYRVSVPPHLEQYEALSYVWGSSASPSHVIVGEERRSISITRNLDVAMRHLRYPDRPRVIWIDALCIDQASTSDKDRQVGYMRHIYWSTPRVVVWLGEEADDSDHALNIIEFVGEKIRVNWFTFKISCIAEEDEDSWGDRVFQRDLPLDARDWAAFTALMKRPWFERIWIRQEVFRAEDEALIYCGRSRISFGVFRRGVFRLARRERSTEAGDAATALRQAHVPLQNLRYSIRGAKCTDPRDYVYGTLGLIAESGFLAISPDYSKSLAEIYQEVVLRYINVYGSLEILESCGNYPADCRHSSSLGSIKLPSWVPDWTSGTDIPFFLFVFRRFTRVAARAEYFGGGILRVAGLKKGVIQNIVEPDTTTQSGFRASLRSIVPKNAAGAQYPGGGTLWDAYRIALCGDLFTDRMVPAVPGFDLSEGDSRAALKAIIHGDEPTLSLQDTPIVPDHSLESSFTATVWVCQETHQFFITEDGLLGWAPKHARQGDHIAIFLGSETPAVIRPVSSTETEQYELIGPCYLHGFMYGQGLLGPLPEGMRPVQHFDGNEPPYFTFLDTISGESSPEDPRSARLPEFAQSWVRRKGDPGRLKIKVEDLQSAGLDIQDFDLV